MKIHRAPNSASAPADNSVTGPKLAAGVVKTLQTAGRNAAGNITLTGLAAGDVILHVQNVTDGGNATTSFTSPVASNNTLAQSSALDLSAKTFLLTVKSGS